MPLTDVQFDLTQTAPVASTAGFTRTIRENLQNEGLVKFRESFVKKLVKTPLSSNLQVSSYKPSEMQEKQNFFYAISQFAQATLYFASWFRSHFADNVFVIQELTETPDPNNPAQPIRAIVETGNLFEIWNQLTLDQVFNSCDAYMRYSTTAIEAQNLNVTWEFLMVNIDADLRATVLSEISRYVTINPDAAQSGPMAFWIIANRIIRSTEALAHNVITGIMAMGLIHFKGENVVDCVATLRHVLLFLSYGKPGSKAPPTIMDILTDIFLRCSNPTFVSYIRNLQDFHPSDIDTPEKLFLKASDYYNNLLLKPNGWLRTTKTRSAFLANVPELTAAMQSEVPFLDDIEEPAKASLSSKKTKSAPTGASASNSDSKTLRVGIDVDRRGNLIDRTPPKQGKSTSRVNKSTNKTKHWCPRCTHGGRWGNHDEAGHDSFVEKSKQRRKEWESKNKNSDSSKETDSKATNSPTTPTMRGNATVCVPMLSAFQPTADDSSAGSM